MKKKRNLRKKQRKMKYYGIKVKDKVIYKGVTYQVEQLSKNGYVLLSDGRKQLAKELTKIK